MIRIAASVLVFVVTSLAAGAEVRFTTPPAARETREGVEISFAVSAATDVEVVILNAQGRAVRHLAAGRLGKNAPAPLQKESLSQALTWDRKDDGGAPVIGPVTVRVRLGLGATLDRFIGRVNGHLGQPTAIGVGPTGEVYVLSNQGHASAYLYVLDRTGRYLRTILPSPANLTNDQLTDLERLTLKDGRVVPIVYQANAAHLAPFLSGIRTQQLFVTAQGWICFASGGNDYSDQNVPRHVLVIKPDGSTPKEVGFVGPPLGPHSRYSIGLRPQQVAVSPDGQTIYFAGMGRGQAGQNPPAGIHTIGRTTWGSDKAPEPFIGKPDEPGSDGEHLNNPVSVACDAKGTIYVVDAGNSRIAAFDPSGKFLGETKVERPAQAAVHPGGALYVLTQPVLAGGARSGPLALIKFNQALGGTEVARLPLNARSSTFALDGSANPPRLWLGIDGRLIPVTDEGAQLAPGENVLPTDGGGFRSPLYLALDVPRERLYVGDLARSIKVVDLKTDQVSPWMQASEPAVDREGNVYVLSGYGTNALLKFTPDGKPLNFSATGTNKIELKYRAGLPHVGVRGLTVAPNGDIYAYQDNNGAPMHLWVFGPDGTLKRNDLIANIPGDSACGVAVDRAGNVYAGINVHDARDLYPPAFGTLIPALGWERTYQATSGWYQNWPQRGVPPAPWDRMYLNYYLYHYGNIFKFPPTGGTFWIGGTPAKSGQNPRPDGVPADAAEYRTGLLKYVVWEKGALWRYPGFALCSNRTETSGDPTCSCWGGRIALDESDRLFVPDVFRFSVGVLDVNGNELVRFGQYGNMDSAGRESSIPEPGIPLGWANTVAVGGGKAYVADRLNRRIVVVNLTCAAEETLALP